METHNPTAHKIWEKYPFFWIFEFPTLSPIVTEKEFGSREVGKKSESPTFRFSIVTGLRWTQGVDFCRPKAGQWFGVLGDILGAVSEKVLHGKFSNWDVLRKILESQKNELGLYLQTPKSFQSFELNTNITRKVIFVHQFEPWASVPTSVVLAAPKK